MMPGESRLSQEASTSRSLISLLRRRAGRVSDRQDGLPAYDGFERLEDRVLLAGDEPNFNQVFGTPNPQTPPTITLDAAGVGTSAIGSGMSSIFPAGDDDMFQFVAPSSDFVRVWADTLAQGSTLDTRVEVYTGTPGGTATLVASGSTQGTLTSGVFKDGWTGFKAVAGTTYYVSVRSDLLTGPGSIGDYTLRINAKSLTFPSMDPANGVSTVSGNLTRRGGDVVYQLTTGPEATFNSLMTIIAQCNPTDLDPRLDIYDANGNLITSDSDSGNLTDSYVAFKSGQSRTFYVRVRSDEFGDPIIRPSTGAYTLVADGIAKNVVIDPVTRLGNSGVRNVPTKQDIDFLTFQAQGTGLSFITIDTNLLGGMPDSAVRIYNSDAVQIGFNELPGNLSRLQIQLTGGQTYYVVVENFDGTAGGLYIGAYEAHHTFDASQPVDDHVNTPANTLPADERARQFELATPIIWGAATDKATPPFPGLPDPSVDHSLVVYGEAQGRIHAGGDTDLFQFVAPVDMAGEFGGKDDGATTAPPPLWRPNYRPATSLQILAFGQTLFNAQVRIYDSNFTQIYGPNDIVITPGFPDPAGVLDPASFPPALPIPDYGFTFAGGQPSRLEIWGGEVYYLEISGTGTGRYDVELQVDAPTDKPTVSKFGPALPNAGDWGNAREILIDQNSGEGRNYTNAAGGSIIPAGLGVFTAVPGIGAAGINLGRAYFANLNGPNPPPAGAGASSNNFIGNPGSRGRVIFRLSDLGELQSPTDTDLYRFRALYTGTAEVRIATTQITDEFFEGIVQTEDGDPMTPPVIEGVLSKTKTYNSPLDSALRIFDNDQTQIAYNNDNSVTGGESDDRSVGAFAAQTFQRRDARAVFHVEAGKTYFIQVESGQRDNFSLTYPKVDWRHATGSYELLINSMSNLNFDDDHVNGAGANAQATPVPIDLNTTSTTAFLGTVPGVIQNTLANPDDTDLFNFLAPASGNAKVTVSVQQGSSFSRTVSVFDIAGQLLGTSTVTGTTDAVVTVLAAQGDRFYVSVDGAGTGPAGEQGAYDVKVSGIPYVDDFASVPNFFAAHIIPKDNYDYDKTETVAGRIESPGDSDIFSFQTIAFDVATITIDSTTPGFHPFVRIYEIGEDGAANPVLLQIAFNSAGASPQSRISFSVTAPPRTSTTTGETYNTYFVVVSGANPNVDAGAYNLRLDLNVATDDHPDAGQYPLADPIVLDPTGFGQATGTQPGAGNENNNYIELTGDSDLFTFVSPAQGLTTITVTSPLGSPLLPRVRVFDANGTPIEDINGQFSVTGPDQAVSQAIFQFTAERDGQYFIQVEGETPFGTTFKTAETGQFTLTVNAPIPDDHPNVGEFPIATPVPLSPFSGDGSAVGVIGVPTDSDLFQFLTITNGPMVVTVNSPTNAFRPFLRLFDQNEQEIGVAVRDGGPGDEDGQLNGAVTRTIASTVSGETYYVLVSSDQTEPPNHVTGGFTLLLNGNTPPPGPDDHANAGDYINATLIPVNTLNGDGYATGTIEVSSDTDLFKFISLSGSPTQPRTTYVQIVTPNGSPLNVGVRIYRFVNGVPTLVSSNSTGSPGSNATTSFPIDSPNEPYWIEVDGLGGTGSYAVKLDTAPNTYFLFYPEGFANQNIREYVSVGNDNAFDVHFTVRLRYESNDPEQVITGVVGAHSRGGITISDGTANPGSGVLFNKPYAIIIESDGFIGANISHYDFGNTLGEAFTGRTSTVWSFAEGERFPGSIADFLLYYNPNPNAVVVTLTAHQTDPVTGTVTTVAMSQTVQAFRRLGWNFNQTPTLPLGKFAFTVTSAPVNPTDPHIGIVAALSHNDLARSFGYAYMGDPDDGSTSSVVPGLISSASSSPSVTLFNGSNTVANVGIVGKYTSAGLPDLVRSIVLQPFQSRTLDATALGLVNNQNLGLRFDSDSRITVLAETVRAGDADATQSSSEAGTSFFFGDAFINRLRAGTLYFEDMYFYNPDVAALPVTLNFSFNDGATSSYTFSVAPKSFATVPLHQLPAILNHAVFNYFSINAVAARPFNVSMTHYDLVLAGGWGTKGAPLGLTNPISTIV